MKPETWKELAIVGKMLGEKYIPGTILKLIHNFQRDQELIKALRGKSAALQIAVDKHNERARLTLKLLHDFILYTSQFIGSLLYCQSLFI